MKRDFKGIWIPKEIWLNKSLTVMEKLFLVEIDSLDHSVDGCYASNGHFSAHFGLSKNRCTEIITALEQKEFITKELVRSGKKIVKRVLKINPIRKTEYLFGKPNNPIRKTEQPYSENREGNNTSIIIQDNNTNNACAPEVISLEYIKEVGKYFGKTTEVQLMKVSAFLKFQVKDQIEDFKIQFLAYKKYKFVSGEKKHRFESFCTEWNEQDWQTLLKNLESIDFKPGANQSYKNFS